MIPKTPALLGILCVGILIASLIGANSSKEFSEFMESTPLQHKLDADSKVLYEINRLGLKYQESNEDEKLDEQNVMMIKKIKDTARNLLEIDSLTVDAMFHRPFELASNIEPFEYNDKSICDVSGNIPIHLKEISQSDMFQRFSEKYSRHHTIELALVDERRGNSAMHYALSASTTDEDGNQYRAMTYFDVNSCDNKLTEPGKYLINCSKNNESFAGSDHPEYVTASLENKEFCTILLSPWHQLVSDYQDTLLDKINEKHETMSSVEIQSLEDAMRFQSEMEQWVLLSNITGNIVQDYYEDEKTQDMIKEYREKYGDLPDELIELLDAKPSSPPSSSKQDTIEKDDDNYNEQEYGNTLSEINQQAITHQNNENFEKFNEHMSLMQQKQKEIAAEILGVNVSTVYIDEGWNFPFLDKSDVTPFPGIEQPALPICDIPENIPNHLEIIRNSEMFSMFSEKYSQNHIEFEASDERNHNSIVHYSIRAISEDQNRTAGVFFHVDSCTGEISVPYNLDCRDNTQGEEGTSNQLQTRFIDEIQSSLDNEEFCVIELEPWHQKMREYHTEIGEQLDQLTKNFEAGNEDINQKEIFQFHLEFQRLGLLNDLLHSITSGTSEDEKAYELILEYEEKYDSLPDELARLLEMKEQHYSSLSSK
ncbi:MAG: hypothetical protein ACR2LL_01295 [Nitrosopumilus sp.]